MYKLGTVFFLQGFYNIEKFRLRCWSSITIGGLAAWLLMSGRWFKKELRFPVKLIIPEICCQLSLQCLLFFLSLCVLLSFSLFISLSIHLHQHRLTKGNVLSLPLLIFPSIPLPAVSPPFPRGPSINNSQSPAETTA